MNKFVKKITNKKIAIAAVILFVISMLPIWYLSGYARPSGDDYGYSAMTHVAWLNTHSVFEVFKAGIQTVKQMYIGWNGNWFTTFIYTLMPEVFAPYTFWIVPIIMTIILIGGTTYFLYVICIKFLELKIEDFVIYDVLTLIISYQFIPSTSIGMYWYVGAVHYILSHVIALLGICAAFNFCNSWKKGNIFWASLCGFLLGGGSFFSCLLFFMTYFSLFVLFIRKNKKTAWLGIPFFLCLFGFVIQCLAPGNTVRGGEGFGLSLPAVISTVIQSLYRGVLTILSYMREKECLFIVLLIIAVFAWDSLKKSKCTFAFRYPLLFVILMYGLYSAMFAPEIYAAVEVSKGPATIQYFTFILTSVLGTFYVEGWVLRKIREKGNPSEITRIFLDELKYRMYVVFPIVILCFFLVVINRSWLSGCVDNQVYEYISSGQAEDFKMQIASQMEILLDDNVKDAYLVPINPDQGPLMHMPVTPDENAFTNRVVRDFYQKDKVVMFTKETN